MERAPAVMLEMDVALPYTWQGGGATVRAKSPIGVLEELLARQALFVQNFLSPARSQQTRVLYHTEAFAGSPELCCLPQSPANGTFHPLRIRQEGGWREELQYHLPSTYRVV